MPCLLFYRDKHGTLRDSRRTSIYRVIGYFPGKPPDVDSLGFPFQVCRMIFMNLSVNDLGSCMRVCKEWRSLIDTCDFWKTYIYRHYGNKLKEPSESSVLFWWKNNQVDMGSTHHVASADDPYVFKPFPDLWIGDVVVPRGLCPPAGSTDVYHNFIKAMESLRCILDRIRCYGLNNIVHVCLFRWIHASFKPSPVDVMNIFNAHVLLTHNVEMRSSGIADDLARITPPHGVDYKGQTYFIDVFSKCFKLGLPGMDSGVSLFQWSARTRSRVHSDAANSWLGWWIIICSLKIVFK